MMYQAQSATYVLWSALRTDQTIKSTHELTRLVGHSDYCVISVYKIIKSQGKYYKIILNTVPTDGLSLSGNTQH